MTSYAEHAFQRSLIRYLRLAVPKPCVIFSVDHAAKASMLQRVRLKERGVISGIHDVFVLWGGHLMTMELKAASGRPSDAQIAFKDDIVSAGGSSFLIRSIDEAETALRTVGVPLLASAQGRDEKLAAWQAKPKAKRKTGGKRDDPAAIRRMMRPGGYADRDPALLKNRTLV